MSKPSQSMRAQRMLRRQWRNGPGGRWTQRARWYDIDGQNIRLNFLNAEYQWNEFPESTEEAQRLWDDFKAGRLKEPNV